MCFAAPNLVAVLTWLGDRAWRLPAWLDRVLPRIDLEGGAPLKPAPEGQSL